MDTREPPSVAIVSLGCPKNLVDSERMLGLLAEAGCAVNAPPEEADVIILNTCGFIEAARSESLDEIRQAIGRKRRGAVGRVVVAGCLANRDGESLWDALPGIDALVGVDDRDEIVRAVTGAGPVTLLSPCEGEIHSDAGRFRLTPRHTAYLRIAEGCSHGCTFCTIPAIRGPFRSKPPEQVLAETRELISDGTVELNLIAQDTTAYGSDLDGGWNLARLLRALDGLDGVGWIRLHYTYPRSVTDELIDAMAACERVVPYLDMPLQHIADGVLKRMGRGVTRADIERLLGRLRDRIPDLTVRTTFIVGFPGETEEDFEELLAFARKQRFAEVGVFGFYAERGTPAAEMPDPIDIDDAARRAEALIDVVDGIAYEQAAAMAGRELRVLVDGLTRGGKCVGRHAGQAPEVDSLCLLEAERPAGTFIDARVSRANGANLICTPVD